MTILTGRNLAVLLTTTLFLGALQGCSPSTEPGEPQIREGAVLTLYGTAGFQMVDLATGVDLVEPTTFTWKASGVVRQGVARNEAGSPGVALAPGGAGGGYTLPDTLVAQVLPMLGFSTGGSGPIYTAPGSASVDTIAFVGDDGAGYSTIISSGSMQQPLTITTSRNGVTIMSATYVWVSVSGGVQASSVTINDWSQPDVLIRTRVNTTSANVVTFTFWEQLVRPNLGRAVVSTAGFLAEFCLPQPLHAQSSGCGTALAAAGFATVYWLASSAAVVSAGAATGGAGAMAAIGWYFVRTGAMITAVVHAAGHCKK